MFSKKQTETLYTGCEQYCQQMDTTDVNTARTLYIFLPKRQVKNLKNHCACQKVLIAIRTVCGSKKSWPPRKTPQNGWFWVLPAWKDKMSWPTQEISCFCCSVFNFQYLNFVFEKEWYDMIRCFLPTVDGQLHKVHLENNSVCPLVRIGTPPPPHLLSRKRVYPPGTKGRSERGGEGSQFGRKKA